MSSINYPERRSRVAILVCLLGLLTILGQVFLHIITVNAGAQPSLTAQQPSIMPLADLSVKGHLAPSDSIEIAMAEGSRAEQVRVAEGQKVSAGQTLLRLDTYSERAAEVAAAELDEVEAQQRLDDLYRTADVALAEAGVALALADKEQKYARDYLASLQISKSQAQIDQAYANLLLRQRQLKLAIDDLQKAENKYANENNIIWLFITKHAFKLRLVDLRKNVTSKERHLEDAQDKYNKLLEPVDPIDLAQAQARLELANARLDKAHQNWEKLRGGPDPDELTAAQANLRLAQAQLQAARAALAATEIVAPASGEVVEVAVKPGEWIQPGQAVIKIADLSQWTVETDEIKETDITRVQPGEQVQVSLAAYPDLKLAGLVETVDQLYTEDEGDIFYKAKIKLEVSDPRLRWGMSAHVDFGSP